MSCHVGFTPGPVAENSFHLDVGVRNSNVLRLMNVMWLLCLCVWFSVSNDSQKKFSSLMNGADCRINGRRGLYKAQLLCRHQRCAGSRSIFVVVPQLRVVYSMMLACPSRHSSFDRSNNKKQVWDGGCVLDRLVAETESYHCACSPGVQLLHPEYGLVSCPNV